MRGVDKQRPPLPLRIILPTTGCGPVPASDIADACRGPGRRIEGVGECRVAMCSLGEYVFCFYWSEYTFHQQFGRYSLVETKSVSRIFRKSQDRPLPLAETVRGKREEGRIDVSATCHFHFYHQTNRFQTSTSTSTMSRIDWNKRTATRTRLSGSLPSRRAALARSWRRPVSVYIHFLGIRKKR